MASVAAFNGTTDWNTTGNAIIAGATNVRAVSMVKWHPAVSTLTEPDAGVIQHRSVDTEQSKLDQALEVYIDMHSAITKWALTTGISVALGPESALIGGIEGVLTITAAASTAIARQMLTSLHSHWQQFLPEDAATVKLDSDLNKITYTFAGTKLKDGSSDTYYDGRDSFSSAGSFSGVTFSEGYDEAKSAPVRVGTTFDGVREVSRLRQFWDRVEGFVVGGSRRATWLRSKNKVGVNSNVNLSAIPGITGTNRIEWVADYVLTTTTPVLDASNLANPVTPGEWRSAPITTYQTADYTGSDAIVYTKFNGKNYILAHWDDTGGTWNLNPDSPIVPTS
jgi:hypothetical protein